MHAPDELSLFASRLEAINSPYMITGATAAILYGQPRVTAIYTEVTIRQLLEVPARCHPSGRLPDAAQAPSSEA